MNGFYVILITLWCGFTTFLGYQLGEKIGRSTRHAEWRECLMKNETKLEIFTCAVDSK
jgi:hypothetical protein